MLARSISVQKRSRYVLLAFSWPRVLTFKNYGMNVAAVVRFLAMHGAAIAEKALVRVSVDAGIVDQQHAGIFEPPADKACEVEHRVSLARGGQEVARIGSVCLHEPLDEFGAYFVGRLADQRADRR